jgi:hypothetical protein
MFVVVVWLGLAGGWSGTVELLVAAPVAAGWLAWLSTCTGSAVHLRWNEVVTLRESILATGTTAALGHDLVFHRESSWIQNPRFRGPNETSRSFTTNVHLHTSCRTCRSTRKNM